MQSSSTTAVAIFPPRTLRQASRTVEFLPDTSRRTTSERNSAEVPPTRSTKAEQTTTTSHRSRKISQNGVDNYRRLPKSAKS